MCGFSWGVLSRRLFYVFRLCLASSFDWRLWPTTAAVKSNTRREQAPTPAAQGTQEDTLTPKHTLSLPSPSPRNAASPNHTEVGLSVCGWVGLCPRVSMCEHTSVYVSASSTHVCFRYAHGTIPASCFVLFSDRFRVAAGVCARAYARTPFLSHQWSLNSFSAHPPRHRQNAGSGHG